MLHDDRMPESFNVLICGKIRDPQQFMADLEVYRFWRSQGMVDRIVFSGWHTEMQDNRPIIDQLQVDGVEVILTAIPTFTVVGHIFHQMKNLVYGLDAFAPSDIVLKTRTDKIFLGIDASQMHADFLRRSNVSRNDIFGSRIKIRSCLATKPFFYNDMIFMGRASDLRKLVSFDLWFEFQHTSLNAEQVMHVAPHRQHHPEIDAFFRVNPGLMYSPSDQAQPVEEVLIHDPLYQNVLYRSLVSLRDYYLIGLAPPEEPFRAETYDGATLLDINERAMRGNLHGMTYNATAQIAEIEREEIVPLLLDLPISQHEKRSLSDVARERQSATSRSYQAEADALAIKLKSTFPMLENLAVAASITPNLKILWQRRSNILN